jgi:hypothetical protein
MRVELSPVLPDKRGETCLSIARWLPQGPDTRDSAKVRFGPAFKAASAPSGRQGHPI